MDHIRRYHDDPNVKMLVVLGEVGGTEEYEIVTYINEGEFGQIYGELAVFNLKWL